MAAAALSLSWLTAGVAGAQPRPAPQAGQHRGVWEVGGGVVYLAGYDLGERAAELTRNSTSTSGGSFEQFSSDSRITAVPGLQARLGYYLTDGLVIEGGFRFLRPVLRIRLTGDTENAPDTSAEETLSQYVVEGSAVWHILPLAFAGGRGVPFLTGGAGYLRELHEGDELVETGTTYHVGGGLKYWFGASRRVGVRGDAGVSFRDGGFDFEEELRPVPTAGASIVFAF